MTSVSEFADMRGPITAGRLDAASDASGAQAAQARQMFQIRPSRIANATAWDRLRSWNRLVTSWTMLLIVRCEYGMAPGIRDSVNEQVISIKNRVNSWLHQERPQIRPSDTTTPQRSTRGHDADQATDEFSNTYWATRATTGRAQPELVVTFAKKVNLKNIVIYNGVGTSKDGYDTFARPSEIHLVYDTNRADDLTLKDVPDKATYSLSHADGITKVHIFVVSYNARNGVNTMALARVDFFSD